jgi:hypothetical protein
MKILVTLLALGSCIKVPEKKLFGRWQSLEDRNWTIEIKVDEFIEIYEKDTLSRYKFQLLDVSCDNSYLSDSIKSDFIYLSNRVDSYCVEVLTIDQEVFTYRETVSGKIHSFKK